MIDELSKLQHAHQESQEEIARTREVSHTAHEAYRSHEAERTSLVQAKEDLQARADLAEQHMKQYEEEVSISTRERDEIQRRLNEVHSQLDAITGEAGTMTPDSRRHVRSGVGKHADVAPDGFSKQSTSASPSLPTLLNLVAASPSGEAKILPSFVHSHPLHSSLPVSSSPLESAKDNKQDIEQELKPLESTTSITGTPLPVRRKRRTPRAPRLFPRVRRPPIVLVEKRHEVETPRTIPKPQSRKNYFDHAAQPLAQELDKAKSVSKHPSRKVEGTSHMEEMGGLKPEEKKARRGRRESNSNQRVDLHQTAGVKPPGPQGSGEMVSEHSQKRGKESTKETDSLVAERKTFPNHQHSGEEHVQKREASKVQMACTKDILSVPSPNEEAEAGRHLVSTCPPGLTATDKLLDTTHAIKSTHTPNTVPKVTGLYTLPPNFEATVTHVSLEF